VERALDALMAVVVHRSEHLMEQGRRRRDVEAALERHHAVDERPQCRALAGGELVAKSDQRRIRVVSLT